MQYYKIEITVNKDGTINEKVVASGTSCTAVTEELEKALGEVRSQELLPEYNDQANQQTEDETLWINH
ncbi:MAG: DUF2997 domain-containing protein [Oscillatoriales cyanobacterium]|uniref:DUF2997 domain-containing protein n=1 Tax=unclassified Microcoleus TaxID=2642155 RepID=UPI001DAC307A|nr:MULTISPECIES: DUF2997 domain-containing protein [unclassified Microcoleus]TAF00896.1 MAG: DUF2997 domain-containing protein [Oscillatoriales cyanobacterium]MCC3459784.1 DUF2997 domain-containing protein [Microcoleus sp. PH2017_11_PCY_U_A]MCC3478217.1 DUF2997 domain-containing protein [Microcoleus sp. PH2017_12_PCY_D_A]TAF21420.1 MAG: DUF2997 domain-containing protein [Oscillatoriales cyanobacterium]TAF39731.1 MAG: DUF2997 domain-containing protein [Oscillatoriales cyanobacterium]